MAAHHGSGIVRPSLQPGPLGGQGRVPQNDPPTPLAPDPEQDPIRPGGPLGLTGVAARAQRGLDLPLGPLQQLREASHGITTRNSTGPAGGTPASKRTAFDGSEVPNALTARSWHV